VAPEESISSNCTTSCLISGNSLDFHSDSEIFVNIFISLYEKKTTHKCPIWERNNSSTASTNGKGVDEDHDLLNNRVSRLVIMEVSPSVLTEVPPSSAALNKKLDLPGQVQWASDKKYEIKYDELVLPEPRCAIS